MTTGMATTYTKSFKFILFNDLQLESPENYVFNFFFFLAAPQGSMLNLSSATRYQTHAPCSRSRVLTTEPLGKTQESDLKKKKKLMKVMNKRTFHNLIKVIAKNCKTVKISFYL